ncbi:MAG: PAS domain-containing protein [Myxococcales bacterium]|nr:PAS domain-containing protein [Myxococcales bacterium]
MEILDRIKAISDVIIDSFFVVDAERTIIDFNRAFHAMLPRSVARGLRGKKCYDVLQLDICKERCIAEQCWKNKRHIRLDEIHGKVVKTNKSMTFILSALPLLDDDGNTLGAIVIHRNVTDEAQVQVKYQEMLDNAKREREQLKHVIRARTKDLLETSQDLLDAQKELMAFKRGRVV